MSNYVLIHGGSDGGFVWEDVAPLLREQGHRVATPDLSGHGEDETPIGEISLGSYAGRICEVLDAQDEPVILVGHSTGGIAITQVAEHRPQKIEALVYLAAYLPRNGQSLFELIESDPEVQGDGVVLNEDGGWLEFPEEVAREAFGTGVPEIRSGLATGRGPVRSPWRRWLRPCSPRRRTSVACRGCTWRPFVTWASLSRYSAGCAPPCHAGSSRWTPATCRCSRRPGDWRSSWLRWRAGRRRSSDRPRNCGSFQVSATGRRNT